MQPYRQAPTYPQQPYQQPYPPQQPYAPPQQYAPAPQYAPQYVPQHAPQQPQYAPPQQYSAPPQQYAPQVPPQGYAVPGAVPNGPPGAGTLKCKFCGCVPAAKVTFRGHQGMIVIMRFLHLEGPFCRDCGLSTFRRMTANTLVQGWWGYASFVITPITVLINLVRRNKVAALPAPQPSPYWQCRPPADPGPPLMARPAAIIGLAIPVVLLILFIVIVALGNG